MDYCFVTKSSEAGDDVWLLETKCVLFLLCRPVFDTQNRKPLLSPSTAFIFDSTTK